jgi:peptide/nickel transport system substrate-binding protein
LKLKFKESIARQKIKKFNAHDERLVQKLASNKKLPTWRQFTYVSNYLSSAEQLLVRILCGLACVSLIALGINLYLTNSSVKPALGGSYTEALVGAPRYINPLFAQANDVDLDLTSIIYSGLFKYTDRGMEKDLVESYQISDDQLTYTIKLRSDVLWHDGEKMSAEDIVFTFGRIMNNKSKTPLYYNFQGVTLNKVDNQTVAFVLKTPFAPFLESLTVGILPEHLWRNINPENMSLTDYNLKPIGSGPYKFLSLIKNKNGEIKSFKLKRNPDYYAGAPYIEELVFKFLENFEQAVETLNNKKVDGISYLPKEIRARVINNRNLNFNLLHLPQYTAVFFNYDNSPILKDLLIRKVLSHAVNKEKIVNEIFNAEAQIIDNGVLPGSLGYNPNTVKYPYNVQHAKDELDKAGWKLTEYKLPEKPTNEKDKEKIESTAPVNEEIYPYPVRKLKDRYLEFTLTTVNQPENVTIAAELQKEWQQIGAKVNLRILNIEDTQIAIKNRSYETLLYGQILGYDPDPYPFWHSGQKVYPGLNLTSLNNPEIDKLLEEARKTVDETKRAEKYQKFQKLMAESVPAIFLFNPTYTYPQNKKIKNFNTSKILNPANRFNQINEWFINTDRQLGK